MLKGGEGRNGQGDDTNDPNEVYPQGSKSGG